MNTPQSIDSAPKDGTVILTDEGLVCFVDMTSHGYTEGSWVSCSPGGYCFSCADEGTWRAFPTLWTQLPEWIK